MAIRSMRVSSAGPAEAEAISASSGALGRITWILEIGHVYIRVEYRKNRDFRVGYSNKTTYTIQKIRVSRYQNSHRSLSNSNLSPNTTPAKFKFFSPTSKRVLNQSMEKDTRALALFCFCGTVDKDIWAASELAKVCGNICIPNPSMPITFEYTRDSHALARNHHRPAYMLT